MFPDDFIPVFEQNGFITQVDFYVLEVVCKTLRERIREHQPNVNISINQSRYLLHDEQYISKIEHMMDRYNVPPELLEFELTESLFFEASKAMIDIMHQLKQLNLQVSIDDFGSGYSSLNVLKDVPADVIKLDKEFLNEKESSKESEIIIQKTVEMAKELNKRVICEGVETIEQVEFLKSIGCDMVQGFYYAKPMPMDEFFERLESEM
jgi:EAL domain-containing protein (putative c-di-GMP-specific phosphodiesterase class I)